MWSKKWYLKRNISCDAHLLNELLEGWVPWDDAIVVSAGKMRKLWDSLSGLRGSVCERRLERSSEACAIAYQNCAVFPSGMTSHSKIAQFNWECIAPFRRESKLGLDGHGLWGRETAVNKKHFRKRQADKGTCVCHFNLHWMYLIFFEMRGKDWI